MSNQKYIIREATSNEFNEIGNLMINVYAQLDGFPSKIEQPKYYKMLLNIGNLTEKPKVKLLIAVSSSRKIVGGVVYFGSMNYYGSGGSATLEKNAAGFRLLAVDHSERGNGIGKILTKACVQLAKDEKQDQVIIHSTQAMQIAWKMYEKMGFKRSKELDFVQGKLPVFGFRLFL